jgi:putative nucleotidyltransferase with HDIG domain
MITGSGLAVWIAALLHGHSDEPVKFACYLLIAVLASTMKVRLPGIEGTMSVQFLFVLLCIMELSFLETLLIGCAAALVQTLWKPKRRPEWIKLGFNLGMTSNAIGLTYLAYHSSAGVLNHSVPLLLVVAACTYFVSNTVPVAVVIALTEQRSLRTIWTETFFWSFPYYLAGAAVVGLIHLATRYVGWQPALLVLPVMYWLYRSYRLYLGRLEEEKKRVEIEKLQVEAEKRNVEEVSALHLRTIEALALAIDAKDHTTQRHLHRVRTYALEVAKELELSEEEWAALRAASLLHDIGKLAVPDHIICKPGRLTAEEFEKMKIHPAVGAEILERVDFPYPVARIVRSHHEKWDGTGYPDGLKGEEIPIGSRILAAVDCLDAFASARQYRQALSLDQAMHKVAEQSGIAFDPRVVEILQRRHVELERLAVTSLSSTEEPRSAEGYRVERGAGPAVGFERRGNGRHTGDTDFLSSIASARQEAHTLFELSQDLGNSLDRMTLDVKQAQEMQQLILPAARTTLPGLVVESEYRPASEVGGDFFQIIPHPTDGSLLIVAGDVMGKGLRAGMLVALLVGAIRSTTEFNDDPLFVLQALNRRLLGRGEATATCLVLRMAADGECLLANAGHVPPYLNGEPLAVEGALPLGLIGDAEFSVMRFTLNAGDRLVLVSDGIAEATNAEGQLFGFERAHQLLQTASTATEVANAAQNFGQEDDISVIAVTRAAVSEPAMA